MSKTLYTAIIGGYDTLKEPPEIKAGWDYVCYSDRPLESRAWEVRVIAPKYGPIKSSREIKIRHDLYTPPGISVWADASMELIGDLDELLFQFHHSDYVISLHPDRNCIYQEGKVCKENGKDHPDIIDEQLKGYRLDGYPSNAGLVASGVIIRSSHSPRFQAFAKAWWNEVFRKSCRDQLSFNYIARSHGFDYDVMPFGKLTSEHFKWHPSHPKMAPAPSSILTPENPSSPLHR